MNADSNRQFQSAGLARRWKDQLFVFLKNKLAPLMNPLRAVWLIGWSTLMFLAGSIFLLFNDQGLDLLYRLIEAHGLHLWFSNIFFFLGVIAWGLSTWYCARLLLTREFSHTDSAFFNETKKLRIWLPRIGGGLVPFVVATGFTRVILAGGAGLFAYFLILIYILLGVVLFMFMWKRRVVWKSRLQGTMPEKVEVNLPHASRHVLQVLFSICFCLLVLFLIFPVGLATTLGAPAILLYAIAFWVLIGSILLTYWPLANRYPSLTLPLILLALVMSLWNDNHTIRSTGVNVATLREEPRNHFRNWLLEKLDQSQGDRPYPVFVVAAAGGGIRAAYWTASVLGRIADESNGTWPDHLYALSGVSGGTVGSTLHAVQIAESDSSPQKLPANFLTRGQNSLRADILSPVVAYLLFPDLLQRFLFYGFSVTDRARAIELAMETAVADPKGVNSDRFARGFLELWSNKANVPVLLLNTTIVETGQRGIISNLKIDGTFTDAVDLLDDELHTQDMPLSTAAHMSARFTYVSPAATIRYSKSGKVWDHVVDGGYFENSGAVTAVELMEGLSEVVGQVEKKRARKVALNLILIRNDPDAPSLCGLETSSAKQPKANFFLNDLLSPIRTMFSTRVARSKQAEKEALKLFRGLHQNTGVQSTNCEDGCIFEFSLEGCDRDPPLGWSLSERSCDLMNEHLDRQRNQFDCIRGLLDGAGCTRAPVCEDSL